jgi:hypothetical protein
VDNPIFDEDLTTIQTCLNDLVGKPCWRVETSYGGVWSLDFGQRIPWEDTKQFFGERWFSTHGTDFELSQNDEKLVASTDDAEELRSTMKMLVDATVMEAELDHKTLGVSLTFSNGIVFKLVPTVDADKYSDIPYWHLVEPNGKALEIYPNRRWIYRSGME